MSKRTVSISENTQSRTLEEVTGNRNERGEIAKKEKERLT